MAQGEPEQTERRVDPLPVDDGSIRASVERLVASSRELATAELDWARLKAGVIAVRLRNGLVLGLLAATFLILAVIVLVAAAVIALAPILGWLGASLVVGGAAIIVAILFALAARRALAGLLGG